MDSSFFGYIQQLELMAFFWGYPLVYALVVMVAGTKEKQGNYKNRFVSLLPLGYALAGTLYLALQLKNFYPDYSIEHLRLSFEKPALTGWGLLSILFWIPALRKRKVLSLLHSLVFFFFLLKDLLLSLFGATTGNSSTIANDMGIYTNSLLLHIACFGLISLLSFLLKLYKRRHLRR